ncbi:MAG: proton-conducting transporter membrane subunit [Firmicutes bacterium]|nr:proton-conducting transporter membrane subunit [Bacillota bacterium]
MKSLHRILSIVMIAAALSLCGFGVASLASKGVDTFLYTHTVLSGSPLIFQIQATPLSGFFLIMLGIVGTLAALYGIGYGQEYKSRHYGVWLDIGLLLFIVAMALVFCADNVFTFMIAWESMSIVSYLLVVYDHEKPGVIRAGLLYVGMTQLGSAFLLTAFLILHHYTGSYDFAVFARLASSLPAGAQSVVFLCALIGFSTKAGLMPLHIWLPEAHPIAPSHISALMSGVMIKTAVFGLILVSIVWLHGAQAWWGAVVVLLGALSAIGGSFWSGQEGSFKRILAFSSIDNIGLIFIAIGVALLEWALHQPLWAAIALTSALLLAFNHALFKSTLFQGAGAVIFACHTGLLNHLGGLMRRMPVTSTGVLIALASLCALPPWGGFTSEWLLFSTLAHVSSLHLHTWVGLLTVAALLGLFATGALTLVSAVRIFGIGFLAEPRTASAAAAREVPLTMRISIAIGAMLTLLSGLMAPWIVSHIEQALPHALLGAPGLTTTIVTLLPPSVLWVIGAVILVGVLLAWLVTRSSKRPRVSLTQTWTCGGQRVPRMSYSATGLSQPVQRVFAFALVPMARQYVYRPALRVVLRTTTSFRIIQSGHVRTYLLYLFATVLLLLLIARLGGY